jgi:ABC-type Fe3+/spermidine/putrescine transport system ATPase subunit
VTSSGLIVRNLTKRFGNDETAAAAVSDVSFEVGSNEFFTMLGPSGCGKTTTLRMIAGLETATAGEITLNGKDYTSVPARHRNIGMVFQSYALFPHLSVFENVAYGLRVRSVSGAEVSTRVRETLGLLGLEALADRLPAKLSGGQQQRVSLARALVYRPESLLLDEPLANLDAKLRVQMREEVRRVQRTLGIMVLYVTHDQEEAMAVSDRIAVFNHGRLIQIDAPANIYAEPRSLFVADFIGKANFIPVRLEGGNAVLPSGQRMMPGRRTSLPRIEFQTVPQNEGVLMIRPEHLAPASGENALEGRVTRLQPLGAVTRYTVWIPALSNPLVMELSHAAEGLKEGGACRIAFAPKDTTLFIRGDGV